MSDIFISYARSTASQARAAAEALRTLAYDVWLDEELLAHGAYTDVIEQQLQAAKLVVVIWSDDAVKSQWVRSEANRAREDGKLVQLNVEDIRLPVPFDQIQCADLVGWSGDRTAPGWRKVLASIADLIGAPHLATAATTSAPPPLPNKPSIAVLPFTNLSGDPEQDYFADGMVEEITRALSRFKSIFVIASGSGLSFKGKATTPQEVARTLGVRYVLEGSVRKAANRVRIAVKLIDGADGAQIWTDRFEDTLEDVFALQDRVALSVAGVIGTAVQDADARRVSRRPTENMNSYDLYLRATALHRTFTKADIFAALDLLNRAIAIDPDFGAAITYAASCHGLIFTAGWSDDPQGHVQEAKKLIERAFILGGDDADVLSLLTLSMRMIGGDVETAAALVDRAMVLNPGSPTVWSMSGWAQLAAGKPELAFEHLATALRLDPQSPYRHTMISGQGRARFTQQRFAEAVPLLRLAAQYLPDDAGIHALLAASYGHLREVSAAREVIARFRERTSVELHDWATALVSPDKKLIVEGIALAEGASPADTPAVN